MNSLDKCGKLGLSAFKIKALFLNLSSQPLSCRLHYLYGVKTRNIERVFFKGKHSTF